MDEACLADETGIRRQQLRQVNDCAICPELRIVAGGTVIRSRSMKCNNVSLICRRSLGYRCAHVLTDAGEGVV